MVTDGETETEVRSKNTPEITTYARQQNENFQDYNFNFKATKN